MYCGIQILRAHVLKDKDQVSQLHAKIMWNVFGNLSGTIFTLAMVSGANYDIQYITMKILSG